MKSDLIVCVFVISHIATLVCYGILHHYVRTRNITHEHLLLGNDCYALGHYMILG